ncbi:MAG: FKBP-type peptidyl-prolyl cis-trans isomerase, partial [Cyclobacteriaceae bacterium]|nr:FKBP-type peptidyl-prolyl cis-trans isomerase [Cyclobacteriaceae bacterium]
AQCSEEEVSLPYKDQLTKDILLIDRYLASNNVTAEADTSGLRYSIIEKGSNFRPLLIDSIQVVYSLRLLNGQTIFSEGSNTLLLNKLIRAWRITLPLVGEGATVRLFVPSGLAYGNYRTGPIPANSNLIFDIELKKVIRDFASQLTRDLFTIDAFLEAENISVRKDAPNLRYVITSAGASTALAPLATDSVVLTYTARSVQTKIIVEPEVSKGLKLNARTTLPAWKNLLPLLREKTKATVYVPSGLGYGAYGKTGVAPYTNLIYEVTVDQVIRK